MIGWVLAAAIVLVVGVFIVRTIIVEPRSDGRPHELIREVASVDILPSEVRESLARTEETVYRKVDEVVRMADRESGIIKRVSVEKERDPLDETSFMRAISDKVEKVKKLSED